MTAMVLVAGCTIDGKSYPCEVGETCDAPDEPTSCVATGTCGPQVPSDLAVNVASGAVAVGGTLNVTVTSRSGSAMHYQAALPLSVRVLRNEPGRLALEVTCGEAGQYVLSYGAAYGDEPLLVTCIPASRVEASLSSLVLPTESDVFFVPADATIADRSVHLAIRDAAERALTDDSFQVTPTSVPALYVQGPHDVLLPTTPGTYDVTVSSRALGEMPRHIRVVDHVDAIVGERTSGNASEGTVCFYGISAGQLVMGAHWRMITSGIVDTVPTDKNCLGYKATTGAVPRVDVAFGGTTQTFALDAI